MGNEIRVSHILTPTIWDADKSEANNPLFNILTSIDIVLIFQGILSLLALLFAYDALAGEYEHGTLRLVLTHPVGRGAILFAKYIGANGLLARAVVDESAPAAYFADDFRHDFPESPTIFCVSVGLF